MHADTNGRQKQELTSLTVTHMCDHTRFCVRESKLLRLSAICFGMHAGCVHIAGLICACVHVM